MFEIKKLSDLNFSQTQLVLGQVENIFFESSWVINNNKNSKTTQRKATTTAKRTMLNNNLKSS